LSGRGNTPFRPASFVTFLSGKEKYNVNKVRWDFAGGYYPPLQGRLYYTIYFFNGKIASPIGRGDYKCGL